MNRDDALSEAAIQAMRPLDMDPPPHVHLRGNRRVLAEELRQAVRDRDGGAMQLAISRLSRLGVGRNDIEKIAQAGLH